MKSTLIIILLALTMNIFGQNYSYLGVPLSLNYLSSNFPNCKVIKGEYDEEQDLVIMAEITGTKANYSYNLSTGPNGKIYSFVYYMNKSLMYSIVNIDNIVDGALIANAGTITTNQRDSRQRYIEKKISNYGEMRINAHWDTNDFGTIFPGTFMIMYVNMAIYLGR